MLQCFHTADATREDLESEIATHARAIIDLKGRLNTMTTVARLPPELLSEVFLHVTRDAYAIYQSSNHLHYGAARFYAWVKVSHVCRSWREVALSTPRLWGHIILTKRSVVEDMLLRSKRAPLSLSAAIFSSKDDRTRVLEQLMQETPRIKELRLSGPVCLLQDFCAKLTEPANNLDTLVLSDNASHTYPLLSNNALSQTVFPGKLPYLRTLEIRGLVFDWTVPVLSPTLTRLVLVGRMDSQSLLGSFNQLLTVLDTMPGLETLVLENAIPRVSSEVTTWSTPQHTIALPQLHELTVHGQSFDCANLINHLRLSSSTHVKLTCRGSPGAQELIGVLKEYATRTSPFLSVHLFRPCITKLQLKAWRNLAEPRPALPCLELHVEGMNSATTKYLVRDSSIIARARNLEIVCEQVAGWRWADVFAGAPNLRSLVVVGDPQDEFLITLSTPHKMKKNHTSTMLLPLLRVLKFSGTRLCSPDYDRDVELFDRLEDWLLMRCNYNVPIERLQLDACVNITHEDIGRLFGIVPYVEWDGLVQFDSDLEADVMDPDDYAEAYYDDDWEAYDYDDYYDDPLGFF
ncbi:hypothetical protein C8Q77DRAFT_1133458 [Trametes polyzona]|nr:hypothetical protein C8Q77DRAFT_1133458 [Trametes polyzona]